MKHFLIIFLFLISSTLPLRVHAGAAGGGASEPTQILNLGELLGIDVSEITTAGATYGTFVKDVILDPIANALISSALEGASNDILSWVSGGFGGKDPLIIGDPASYLKNEGLKSVKGILDSVPSDSIYGDSIFNSLLGQYKDGGDLKSTIASLSKSEIPSLIQDNLCTDEELTSLALGAVQDADGTYSADELAAKKTELWDYACVGDPNSDPETATRLQDLNQQNSSIGGWDVWLAKTGGSNEYTKSKLASVDVAQKNEEQKQFGIKDIFDGQGPVSERECVEYETDTAPGEDAMCLEWTTVTPGDQVGDTLSSALTSGIDRLENIMGDGSLTGMLQGFAISAITSGIKKALNSSTGSKKYNLPVTLPSARPVVQDLKNDPLRKAESQKPMNKQLTFYQNSLNSLSSTDSKYMAELTAYETRVTTIKDCAQGAAVYANRMGRITPVKASITAEQAKIVTAQTLINDTQAKLDATNSSQEQNTIFNAYLSAVEDRGLPNTQTEAVRLGEYNRNKFDVSHDDELTNMITACAVVVVDPNTVVPRESGCFTPGTLVTMGDGSKKKIENVTLGEELLTSSGPSKTEKLIRIHHKGDIYAFNGSNNYFVTASHVFITTDGLKSLDPAATRAEELAEGAVLLNVKKLQVGDTLIKVDGSHEKLTSLEKKYYEGTVYNFKVGKSHDYYADEYLVHNQK